MADPYVTLGVQRSASEKEIKSAYRKLAKELHPDRNTDNPAAAERFSDATRAYDLLSDKNQRARFDRGEIDGEGNPANPFAGMGGGMGGGGSRGFGRGGYAPGGTYGAGPGAGRRSAGYGDQEFGGYGGADEMDLGDLFEGLFGGGGARMQEPPRRGFGQRGAAPKKRGADIQYRLAVPFVDAASGRDQRITLADGKAINLKLPAGVEDGTQMRLKSKGHEGPGGKGDGIVMVEIGPHPFFRRDGDNIRMELPITLDEALHGGKVKCPTVDGPVMLTIKPGTDGGTVMRLAGKGWTKKGKAAKDAGPVRGDQLVTLEIQLPKDVATLGEKLGDWRDPARPRDKFGL
jgi:DnaJ-class molecular chaperone